jgi:hypothetical protein
MIDQRRRFERAFGLFDMPEPALELLRTRRDRKRRNQRIAAGAVGLAVVIAGALFVVRAFEPRSSGRDVGVSPTRPRTVTFESRMYGYSLSYPEAWTVQPASARWRSGWLSEGYTDRFLHPTGGTIALIASIPIPQRMTAQEWHELQDRQHAPYVGLRSCRKGEHGVLRTEVDGVPGRYSPDCGLITVVVDRRGYVIRVHADLAVRIDVRQFVQSIQLSPEEV